MQMDYTIDSKKDFDATVEAVQNETAAAGFKVQFVHDVSATLAEKGFTRDRVTIIELCNARHAYAVLEADVRIGLMLPCPVMVFEEDGAVKISTMRPTMLASMFPESDLGNVPEEVEEAIIGIVDKAAE